MTTAFVLGGGGLLGAHEVGMLRALAEAGVRPDLVVGTSTGALNAVLVAADPAGAADRPSGTARWFSSGPVVPAVMASCAVPGLLPPVEIDGEHYFDGGLVDSIPVGRALALGASTVYVLQVGRIESPLAVPRRPWEVGLVAFEIARRHRFHEEMSSLPDHVRVHVLPTGGDRLPPGRAQFRYRARAQARSRLRRAYAPPGRHLPAPPR